MKLKNVSLWQKAKQKIRSLVTMASTSCVNSPDKFCYICGEFVLKKQLKSITESVKVKYVEHFGFAIGHQDKTWAPHNICVRCTTYLYKNKFKFDIPMLWMEPQNHYDDCYFCLTNVQGFNATNKSFIQYPDLSTTRRPILTN